MVIIHPQTRSCEVWKMSFVFQHHKNYPLNKSPAITDSFLLLYTHTCTWCQHFLLYIPFISSLELVWAIYFFPLNRFCCNWGLLSFTLFLFCFQPFWSSIYCVKYLIRIMQAKILQVKSLKQFSSHTTFTYTRVSQNTYFFPHH